jgi:undecaprenyl diphosphate synthase
MLISQHPLHAMPQHVAIIMDGNGRWAAQRGLPRSRGHRAGVDALRRAVKSAADLGLQYLTIYSFSSENWSRPAAEVSFLLDLLRRFIRQDVAELHSSGVRIKVIGARDNLDPGIVKLLNDAEFLTQKNDKLNLIVAFNYGSRQEISRAVQQIAAKAKKGEIEISSITPDIISEHLDTGGVPEPDLLIRTGGEKRISNFLLWQCAYTEFVFVEEFWPDFTHEIFARALDEYRVRDRRFGGIEAQTA